MGDEQAPVLRGMVERRPARDHRSGQEVGDDASPMLRDHVFRLDLDLIGPHPACDRRDGAVRDTTKACRLGREIVGERDRHAVRLLERALPPNPYDDAMEAAALWISFVSTAAAIASAIMAWVSRADAIAARNAADASEAKATASAESSAAALREIADTFGAAEQARKEHAVAVIGAPELAARRAFRTEVLEELDRASDAYAVGDAHRQDQLSDLHRRGRQLFPSNSTGLMMSMVEAKYMAVVNPRFGGFDSMNANMAMSLFREARVLVTTWAEDPSQFDTAPAE